MKPGIPPPGGSWGRMRDACFLSELQRRVQACLRRWQADLCQPMRGWVFQSDGDQERSVFKDPYHQAPMDVDGNKIAGMCVCITVQAELAPQRSKLWLQFSTHLPTPNNRHYNTHQFVLIDNLTGMMWQSQTEDYCWISRMNTALALSQL